MDLITTKLLKVLKVNNIYNKYILNTVLELEDYKRIEFLNELIYSTIKSKYDIEINSDLLLLIIDYDIVEDYNYYNLIIQLEEFKVFENLNELEKHSYLNENDVINTLFEIDDKLYVKLQIGEVYE